MPLNYSIVVKQLRGRLCRFLIVLVAVAPIAGRDRGAQAEYIGGTVEDLTVGVEGALFTTHRTMFHFATKRTAFAVPYARINLLEYGQKVDRRYIAAVVISPLFLLSKARKHFLTLGYIDEQGSAGTRVPGGERRRAGGIGFARGADGHQSDVSG